MGHFRSKKGTKVQIKTNLKESTVWTTVLKGLLKPPVERGERTMGAITIVVIKVLLPIPGNLFLEPLSVLLRGRGRRPRRGLGGWRGRRGVGGVEVGVAVLRPGKRKRGAGLSRRSSPGHRVKEVGRDRNRSKGRR